MTQVQRYSSEVLETHRPLKHVALCMADSFSTRSPKTFQIQVKLINNENTQYVVGSGQGRASTIGKGFLMNPNMAWNQSSLSSASNKAMETAVVNVIKAIDRRGW